MTQNAAAATVRKRAGSCDPFFRHALGLELVRQDIAKCNLTCSALSGTAVEY
jgi:hypothetical protein